MERNQEIGMLDLMARPAFCAADGRVIRVNDQAAAFGIAAGMDIAGLLLTGAEEYAAFEGGRLQVTLSVRDQALSASISRMESFDVFCLDRDEDDEALQVMALIARELRKPLDSVMLTAQQIYPVEGLRDDPATQKKVAQMNRGLYQILRVVGNMADASENAANMVHMEMVDIPAVLAEIFAKAAALVAHTEITLAYQGYPESIYGLADRQSLERAVLNLVSNAVKFSRSGDTIRAALTRRGQKFYLTLEDNGDGIPAEIRGQVFSRYQRRCDMEDRRFGLGIGLVLVRAAAAAHGGTVLLDSGDWGTRITMSLAIRQGDNLVRRNPISVQYAAERDPFLVELSNQLPEMLYKDEY